MVRLSVPILFLAASGCGTVTCLTLAQENPKVQPIYGGVRTDINCIFGVKPASEDGNGYGLQKLIEGVAKPFSVIDLPLSLAADTLTLPYAVWWTVRNWQLQQVDANEVISAGPSHSRPAVVNDMAEKTK